MDISFSDYLSGIKNILQEKRQGGKIFLVHLGQKGPYTIPMKNNSVMIVEDDKDIRNTLSLALELEGYKVLEADNGQSALETLLALPEASLPGCIILDLMMPVMDGMTLLKTIYEKFNEKLGNIPIVVTSANSELLDVQLSSVIAANIPKPFTLDQVYKAVGQFCLRPTA